MSATPRSRAGGIGRGDTRLGDIGAVVPASAVRAALAIVVLALAASRPLEAWSWIAAVTGLAAAATSWVPLAWVAILSLGLSELVSPDGPAAWHPYVLLAGLTLAQLLAARVAVTPLRARIAVRVFARPILVAATVLAPCEGLLALALWLREKPHLAWLPATAVGALALLALGWLLFARLLTTAE